MRAIGDKPNQLVTNGQLGSAAYVDITDVGLNVNVGTPTAANTARNTLTVWRDGGVIKLAVNDNGVIKTLEMT